MKQFTIAGWIIEVDVDKTSEYYASERTHAEACSCIYCRNYVMAFETIPKSVLIFLNSLGIDPIKQVGEIFESCRNENGSHLYHGWYHVVGRIIQGIDCMVPPTNWREIDLYIVDGIKFGFTNKLELVAENFPEPTIQLEFEANIPWVLNEPPES
ncbi:hypothetical protein ACP26L_18860 [Paenibacillus sp. S-38]|uniref:hypothetical protein n=1 Tax=Paenibacillus sp. S-38 TaxID=3416710 RepID=UPI003CFB2D47